jgi:polyhydroxybutyrate depolymerase
MTTRAGALLGMTILLLSGSRLAAQGPDVEQARSLEVDGLRRSYLLYVPPARSAPQALPLVLVFHAAGGDGRGIARHTGFTELARREGFVVAYPDGIGGRWNDGRRAGGRDDVGFVRAILDSIRRELPVDSSRIYAAGISNGAMLLHRLACELPGVLAAIAPVAGGFPASLSARCAGAEPVSVIAFHGTADRSIPYAGGGGPRGQVLSAQRSVARWAEAGGCVGPPAETAPVDSVSDGTRLQRRGSGGCAGGREVVLYTITGGGHTWPGGPADAGRAGRVSREIDATRAIWEFFHHHPAPEP